MKYIDKYEKRKENGETESYRDGANTVIGRIYSARLTKHPTDISTPHMTIKVNLCPLLQTFVGFGNVKSVYYTPKWK